MSDEPTLGKSQRPDKSARMRDLGQVARLWNRKYTTLSENVREYPHKPYAAMATLLLLIAWVYIHSN